MFNLGFDDSFLKKRKGLRRSVIHTSNVEKKNNRRCMKYLNILSSICSVSRVIFPRLLKTIESTLNPFLIKKELIMLKPSKFSFNMKFLIKYTVTPDPLNPN